ncbi:MAG: hypothetical protein JSS29_19675 [Proteobacteria bacterium]|nr:hypothetical protein [Pseudomonadota bacterium]
MDKLIVVAGVALVSHLALCMVLLRRLRDREDLLKELFAVPNSRLSEGRGVKILRVRYYLPWGGSALGGTPIDAVSRAALVAARLTGMAVPVALLAFLAIPFIQAT